jgi:catechol 2,3-dioxygenase-like lactoylglutathione lyase family enzyme
MINLIKRILAYAFALFLLANDSTAQVKAVAQFGITVKDMERSVKFYSEVLGFEKVSDAEVYGEDREQLQGLFGVRMRIVRMRLGDEFVELTDYLTTGGRSIPEDTKSNDLIFQHIAIVVSDMDEAYKQLRKYHVIHVSTAPQTIPASNAAAAGIRAFYFQDPDMHNLELIYFPAGKGLPKWQRRDKLFLGIDHSAIAIRDTKQSLNFYESILGILKRGESHNTGTEQAHLNFVKDATVHITGLRATDGPGIEFLQYIKPGSGKDYPADSRADDIWHWQTTLIVADADALFNQLKKSGMQVVSSNLVSIDTNKKAFIVRDPDGHALLIRE